MQFNSIEDLYKIIQNISNKYYSIIQENCFFLEEAKNKSFVIFMKEIRDAYSHLAIIFQYKDLNKKENIKEHLIKFEGHLQKLCYETFKMINEYYLELINKKFKKKTIINIRHEIAKLIKECRLATNEISSDEKISGYKRLINEYENILKNDKLK